MTDIRRCRCFSEVTARMSAITPLLLLLSMLVAHAQEAAHRSPTCETCFSTQGECPPQDMDIEEDEGDSFDSDGSFMQTLLRVKSNSEAERTKHETARALGSSAEQVTSTESNGTHAVESNSSDVTAQKYPANIGHGGLASASKLNTTVECKDKSFVYLPPVLARNVELLRMKGYNSIAPPCHKPQIIGSSMLVGDHRLLSLLGSSASHIPNVGFLQWWQSHQAKCVAVVYGALFLSLVAFLLYNIRKAPSPENLKRTASQKPSRPGLEAWNVNIVSWVYASWATGWVAKWGNIENSDFTKVEPHEIGALSGEEDDSRPCYERFEKAWKTEVSEVGLQNANLARVCYKMIGFPRIFANFFWLFLFELCFYFAPPLCIDYASNFFNWYYLQISLGETVSEDMLRTTALLMIFMFTGLPLTSGLTSNISRLINARICCNLSGALSLAVYDKALRLPVSVQQAALQMSTAEERCQEPGPGRVFAGPARADSSSGSDGHPYARSLRKSKPRDLEDGITEAHDVAEDHEEAWTSQTSSRSSLSSQVTPPSFSPQSTPEHVKEANVHVKYHLGQLVMNDISQNIVQLQYGLTRGAALAPVTLAMFIAVCVKLGWCSTLSTLIAVLCMVFLCTSGAKIGQSLARYFTQQGKRLQTFQQYMFGIRYIKCCGLEGIAQSKLLELREAEYTFLADYYRYLGYVIVTLHNAPKAIFFLSLSCYLWIFGGIEARDIIVLAALLSQFNLCVTAVMDVLPQLGAAMPSLHRVQHFLRHPDGPGLQLPSDSDVCPSSDAAPSASRVPSFMVLWPKSGYLPLSVKGDFSWRKHEKPVLRNLDIQIPRGSLVAIVGSVGSGKSSLIHCILGELYPHSKAKVQRPHSIAYSAQEPNIIEGTLKENVQFGYPFDQERFQEAIRASCLIPDLELLPGGEEAPVGSQGIALSGGQRARVSIARAAYSMGTDLMLLDDPFAAVDAHTSAVIADTYLRGKIMEGRTRLVVCQPEVSLMSRFDQVLVMEGGSVREQGTPEKVMQSGAFKDLLSSCEAKQARDGVAQDARIRWRSTKKSSTLQGKDVPVTLRSEEFQGQASSATVDAFLRMGGFWSWWLSFLLLAVHKGLDCLCLLVLAIWMTAAAAHENGMGPPIKHYTFMLWFLFLTILACISYVFSWRLGMRFTASLSRNCYTEVLKNLLRAPIDAFHDKTPVGRILNRMTTDLSQIDMTAYYKIMSSLGFLAGTVAPLVYVHIVVPFWFTCLSMPLYYLILLLLRKSWNTMMPLRYITNVVKSSVNMALSEVEKSNATVRAYCKCGERLSQFQQVIDDHVKCDFSSSIILERWLLIRLYTFGAGFLTSVCLVALVLPGRWNVGMVNLAILNIFIVIINFELVSTMGCSSQYELIAMNRIHDFTNLPQEKAAVLPSDFRFANAKLLQVGLQAQFGALTFVRNGTKGIQIFRETHIGRDLLLEQVPGKPAFRAAARKTLADLGFHDAQAFDAWHSIVAVNDVRGDAQAMASELCQIARPTAPVTLHLVSGWMADGAKVEIEELAAGYNDNFQSQNVLRGINLTIPAKAKAGIVGTTGSGKSTLLLCMLRILEPRAGRIKIENVDVTSLGIQTLRSVIGFVPQDPTLMVGTLRSNIDPFSDHSDESIWKVLRETRLASFVQDSNGQLEMAVTAEGDNLSFGQRQLLCIARMLLRQPALLLLDEATSAIDPATQEVVRASIECRFPESTIICVAHRLDTILNFDMVAVLEKGRVVEQGSAQELAHQKGSMFASMLSAKRVS